MRWRTLGIGVAVLLVLVVGLVVHTLWLAGAFRSIEPHFAGSCRRVEGPPGPEDLTIDARTGIAYVSASDRRARAAGRPVPGAILAYDLTDPEAHLVNLTPDADPSFQPHGLGLWPEEGGDGVLFVVNHPAGVEGPAHTVEVFDLQDGALSHRETLADPLLVMPNDIVPVGPDRFYVTNTHANPPGAMQTVETYLRIAWANVVLYRDRRFRPAAENLLFPNGINASPDGRTIYVASTTGRSLLVFERDPVTDVLTQIDEIEIGTGLDNIEVDGEGGLWIGAHPKLLRLGPHMADPSVASPSQIVHIVPRGGAFEVEETYLDDGAEISASSVGGSWGRRLLIGQIASAGFLDCVRD